MPGLRWAGLALAALLLVLSPPPAFTQEFFWPATEYRCFDATQPDTLLFANRVSGVDGLPRGSYAYDWASGERTLLSEIPFSICNPASGLLYAYPPADAEAPEYAALLFSAASAQVFPIDHMPTHLAAVGSL